MFNPEDLPRLQEVIRQRTMGDSFLLEGLREDVRVLKDEVRVIQPRSVTAVSLVASDGGNNSLSFDPFFIQLVRVVDSYGKQLCLDAVSPTSDPDQLSAEQFNQDGTPRTALGQLMVDLDVHPRTLNRLCRYIPSADQVKRNPKGMVPSWVQTYRDICEWAALYERICHRTFATDTLIVRDGLLRTTIFHDGLFAAFRQRVESAIERIYREDRRRVYLVGLAKRSKVLTRYNLAMTVEQTLPPGEARYVRVPRGMESNTYNWQAYPGGTASEDGELPILVAGDMYFVRFGPRSGDPVWTIDLLSCQSERVAEIFGYLLADAKEGFPVPYYPRCLQKAHEYARIGGFDLEILQDAIRESVRGLIPVNRQVQFDALALKTGAGSGSQ